MKITKVFVIESFTASVAFNAPYTLRLQQDETCTDVRSEITLNAAGMEQALLVPTVELAGKKVLLTLTARDVTGYDVEPAPNAAGVCELYEKKQWVGDEGFVERLLKVKTRVHHRHVGPLPCPQYEVSMLLSDTEFNECCRQSAGTHYEVDLASAPPGI